MATPAAPAHDDAADRFSLLELDTPTATATAPKAAPAPVVKPAPAVTVAPVAAPSLLVEGRALFATMTTEDALDTAARAMAARCIEAFGPDANHPTRVALREAYKARKVEVQRAAWFALFAALWVRIWGSFCLGVQARPHVRGDGLPHSLPEAPTGRVVPVEPTVTGDSLVDALHVASAEGAVMVASQASGSLRDGTMRGVGFSTAQGYVQALANGTKEPTTSQYLSILRQTYGYTEAQIAGLTIGTIVQSDKPVGKGVVHDRRITLPNGQKGSIFDLPAAQRRALVGQRMTAHVVPKAEDLLVTRIAGAKQPRQFSWSGAGRRHTAGNGQQVGACSRADLIARLTATGHANLAPKVKSAVAHAGHAALALNVGGLVVRRVKSLATECRIDGQVVPVTPDVRARWQIGRLGRTDLDLVVDLTKGNELRTTGDGTLAAKVRADYRARLDAEVYQSGELTSWLQETLRVWFSAAQNGVNWYVPAEHSDEARILVRSLAGRGGDGAIWGTSWCCGQAVTTEEELVLGLTAGFLDDVDTVAADLAKAREGNVGPRAYVTLLARCGEHGERINHYESILGTEAIAPLRAKVTALRAEIEPLCDDGTQRAALLEFDLDDE